MSLDGLFDRPAWQAGAACRGMDPDLFFPERGDSTKEAKEVCRRAAVSLTILVCGGRDFTDYDAVRRALDPYLDAVPHTLVTGGARGADALAERYVTEFGWNVEVYPANWKRDGKAAGPIRNQQMLDEAHPDVVVAFPGGRGTADMVRRARAAGVKVEEVR